ncbi:hypothetical protein ASD23_14460 [Agromyces sp. Root1464]|nr:hypothetical protein ASD23_14460 [Agromyces sp. Root1464]
MKVFSTAGSTSSAGVTVSDGEATAAGAISSASAGAAVRIEPPRASSAAREPASQRLEWVDIGDGVFTTRSSRHGEATARTVRRTQARGGSGCTELGKPQLRMTLE